tara:strand:- start:208 stop:369 length:162 start_codon:yes stop_codon:yes gene_type:complete
MPSKKGFGNSRKKSSSPLYKNSDIDKEPQVQQAFEKKGPRSEGKRGKGTGWAK